MSLCNAQSNILVNIGTIHLGTMLKNVKVCLLVVLYVKAMSTERFAMTVKPFHNIFYKQLHFNMLF